MTSPYETIVFTAVIAAFGYFFPHLLLALHFEWWTVPLFTIVGMNSMAYWLLIPSFKYRKTCRKCGETNKLSAEKCSHCKQEFPVETSPYEVVSFAAVLFAFGYSISRLLASAYVTGLFAIALTAPALLIMGTWLLLPNLRHRKICDQCGTVNKRGSKVCYSCGQNLG